MDHEQAVQTQASMRYALGELTPDERDSFEEHFADCSYCLSDVEAATAFAANARQVLLERPITPERATGRTWLRWPSFPALAFSGALNLLLVAGLGYGLLRPHPPAPSGALVNDVPQNVEIVPVRGATRSADGTPQMVKASRSPIILTFDLPQSYEHYYYSIERPGTAALSGELSVSGHPDTLNFEIPAARLSPGEYRVTVTAATGAARESLGTCLLQIQAH